MLPSRPKKVQVPTPNRAMLETESGLSIGISIIWSRSESAIGPTHALQTGRKVKQGK